MKKISCCCLLASLTGSIFILNAIGAAPPGWKDRSFGKDQQTGSTTVDISGGVTNLTVEAEGADIWGTDDYGRFVFTPVAGDCEIIATIPIIPTNTADYGEWARSGLMMRGSTMHGAQNIAALRARGTDLSGAVTKLQRRLAIRGTTGNWTGAANTILDYPFTTVRMRLIRQGDTFYAWNSTNAPAYDQWTLAGSATYTGTYPDALNLGVVVSRWQDRGPNTLTIAYSNVVARKLVKSNTYASGITIDWINDTPVETGSVVGYSVNRAPKNSDNFTEITTTLPGATAWSDSTAGYGTSFVYRVYAQVADGAVTNDFLVGSSLPERRHLTTGNPSPAAIKGVAAEYYDNTSGYDPVGARVDPYMYDSWNLGGNDVYPANTGNGLTDMNSFRATWNGNIIVEDTGCYELVMFPDDIPNVYVNEERLIYNNSYQSGKWIYTAPFWMEAGRSYSFKCDMQENSGGEALRINWFKGDSTEVTMPQAVLEPFPLPWQHRDIGDSPLFGNAIFDSDDISFTVTSSGNDIDNQHMIWQKSSTDFDLIASAELTNPVEAGVNGGVTVRSSADKGAQTVSIALLSDGAAGTDRRIALTIRESDGGATTESSTTIAEAVADLRISRRADSLLACYRTASSSGWVIATNLAINLPNEVCLGIQSYSGTSGVLASNIFNSVTFADTEQPAFSATAANLSADIVSGANALEYRQAKINLSSVGYLWYSSLSAVTGDGYTVFKSDHWDNNYAVLTNLNAANSYTAVDPLSASNTVYFYKMNYMYDFGAFADSSTNDILYTSARIGVSDGSIDAGGTGLYNAYYRGMNDHFPTTLPVHTEIRALNSWEKDTSTPMVTAANSDDGLQVGPDNFSTSWSGYITPPYSGYYSFRTRTDDAIVVSVDGKMIIQYYGYPNYLTADDIYLEAGVPVPVYYYFMQGGGGGFFFAWWKTGVGTNAEYVGIPTTALTPLAPEDAPFAVAPGGANEFGEWQNTDINNPQRPGHAILGGTPEAFDIKMAGGGSDVWGTADKCHLLYRECSENFELKGTINALLYSDPWCKVGFTVRETTAGGSRHISIIQSANNGRHTQHRASTNGGSASHDGVNRAMLNDGGSTSYTPTTFKVVRTGRKISLFIDDTPVPLANSTNFEYDISAWGSDTILAGFYVTSHDDNELSEGMYNDVTFTIIHPGGTMILLR